MVESPAGAPASQFWKVLALYTAVCAAGLAVPVFQGFTMLAAPVPIAVYTARRMAGHVAALLAAAFTAQTVMAWVALKHVGPVSFELMLFSGSLGVPIGWALRRHWTYNAVVILAAAVSSFVICVAMLFQRDAVAEGLSIAIESLRNTANPTPQQLSAAEWLSERAHYVLYGATAGATFVVSSFATSAAGRWLAVRGRYQMSGVFREMRQPDLLVWVLIVASVSAFIDYQWDVPWVGLLAWNTLAALAGVYWTCGLAIAAYAVWKLRPPLWAVYAVLLAIMLLGMAPMLAIVGLMDTWGEFRKRLDRWAAARQDEDTSDRWD